MSNKLAFALDIADEKEATRMLDLIDPYIGAVKVGMEYFYANGSLPKTNKPIILDLKLHDIPETVARALSGVCARFNNIKYITLHIQQRATLVKALEAVKPYDVTLLAVSVLSSMDIQDLRDVNGDQEMGGDYELVNLVSKRAKLAHDCGIRGMVCSPLEVNNLRINFKDTFFLVPGIRPAFSQTDDQKRISTPYRAIKNGASMIVVGRPIRDAKDPAEAAKVISKEIQDVT